MSLLDRAGALLDRGVALAERFAPAWGMKRELARQTTATIRAQGYSQHGASRSSRAMAGWVTARGGPDADITLNLDLLRQRSRDLCMGEPLAIGGLKTIRVNEIGAGLRLNAHVDADYLGLSEEQSLEWEAHVEREFASWAGSVECDLGRRFTFGELQAIARLSELVSGDVFVLLPAVERPGSRYDLKIRLLEADRVSDPWPYPVGTNTLGGVKIDDRTGEPISYYVARVHPGDLFLPGSYGGYGAYAYGAVSVPPMMEGGIYGAQWNQWDEVPAFGATGRRLILHIFEAERPDQRRGVPLLAPVMERLKQLSRYSDAEIMAAVVSGFFTAAITSERSSPMPGAVLPPDQQLADAEPASYQLGNGAVLGLLPGEKLESVDPGRPNAQFAPFVQAVCQQIGAGIGIPYELLVMQFTSSYSASRGALLEAWKRFHVGRQNVASRFCQPIYEQWLEEAVARGYVDAPGFFSDPLVRAAWCGAEWHGPTQGQLDPVKEVTAAEMRVASGFSTRTRETAELTGGNWERWNKIREREERLRREAKVVMAPGPGTPDEPPAEAA